MLSLRVNNQTVDLGDDISISWELRSPMFYEMGSRSYPFRIKNTPYNQKIFGYRHRIEGFNDVYSEFPCEIAFKGIDMFRGTLKFRVLNSQYYECTVYNREGDFFYKSKGVTLRQINFGEIFSANNYYAQVYINNCKGKFYPERNVAFPVIYNPYYFDPPTTDNEQEYFNYHQANGTVTEFTTGFNRTVIVPMVYFRHVLETVLSYLGYRVYDDVFASNSEFNKLVIFNSLSCNSQCDDFAYTIQHMYLNLHLPNITVNEFITTVEAYFNCRFLVNDIERAIHIVPLCGLVNNANAIDFSSAVTSKSIELDEPTTGLKLTMAIDSSDEHMKLWTENQDVYLKYLCPPVDALADLPAWPYAMVRDVRFVSSLNKYYQFTLAKTWVESADVKAALLSNYFIGDSSKNLDLKLSALKNGYPGFPGWQSSCGNTKADWKDIMFKMFFVKMISSNESTFTTSSDTSTSMYLWFNGTNNVYDKFHKDWISFLFSTKAVKVFRQMSLSDIRGLDFSKKILIDSNKFFIRRLQVTLKKNEIMTSALECLTVK